MTKKALPRPSSSNPQIGAYVRAVKKGLQAQHVTLSSKGWAVKRAGAVRPSAVFRTQEQALRAATQIAKNNKTEVFIHGRNGRIRERNSYGSDPFPPRG
ncbi:MAG: DUF2188 domain-containing protein [Candidatus Saccharimonadales bacterium]